MGASRTGSSPSFGGEWTETKLEILESYLNAYTTALKCKGFQLVYIDAFAGSGEIRQDGSGHAEVDERDARALIAGSAKRALRVDEPPFDRLVFVEADPRRAKQLESLRRRHRHRHIDVRNTDANEFLSGLEPSAYGNWRGVLFVDPFGAQVDWVTIKAVAQLRRLDMWLLFPVSAVARMLPLSGDPADISTAWEGRLNRVYGGESWRGLYAPDSQFGLFEDDPAAVRAPGVDGLLAIYRQQLEREFGDRLLDESRTLKQSTNSPLFELMFCAGHPRGVEPAKRIARHLIRKW